MKDWPKYDWKDEHGSYVDVPSKVCFEGYEAEFELAYKGRELASNPFNLSLAFTQISAFKKWLSGNDDLTNHPNGTGDELQIYSPYPSIGRQGCHLLEISDEEPCVQTVGEAGNLYHENVVTFKVKFWVNDPMTDITLSTS